MLPDDKIVRNELLTEVEFYQIEGIIEEMRARPFKDSMILTSEQREQLIDLLKETLESASDDYVTFCYTAGGVHTPIALHCGSVIFNMAVKAVEIATV